MSEKTTSGAWWVPGMLTAVVLVAWGGHRASQDADPIARAEAFYQAQMPYLRPVAHQQTPQGLPDIRAETCGACHREIYQEWKLSTHAHAWLDDAQFQKELVKSSQKGQDIGWACINCHTPLMNQLPRLVVDLEEDHLGKPVYVKNPAYDEVLQREAITCATCHVRDGFILGTRGGTDAPHPVKVSQELSSPDLCRRCHQAVADLPDLTLSCFFNTGEELAQSDYGAQGATCQSCHMPQVERPLTSLGTPPRANRRHWFGGSLIPKKPEFAKELEPLKEVYPPGLVMTWEGLPEVLKPGPVELTFTVTNQNAGHYVPTGDPERFVILRAEATGPGGERLAMRKERIGAHIQWFPEVKKISDNRIKPRESRSYHISFHVPEQGPIKLRLLGERWRISQENLAYHELEGQYVPGASFSDSSLTLPVEP